MEIDSSERSRFYQLPTEKEVDHSRHVYDREERQPAHPPTRREAAHFLSRRFDQAAAKLLLAMQENPSFAAPYRVLAACYAHMGRPEDAREIVARLRANFTPVVLTDVSQVRSAEHRELLVSGLRLAMGETVEQMDATTLIVPGATATVDPYLNLLLELS
jgi:tetratricopeptide repeat protein